MSCRRLVVTLGPVGLTLALAGAGLLPLTGCVSIKRTPAARYFVLRSLVEQKTVATPSAGALGLLPARIPGALDRPQLVSWAAPNELRLDEFQRWAEPLDEALTRTLAENLAALLPYERVRRAPWPASFAPRSRVATELRVLGLQPDGTVRIEAAFTLLAGEDERVLARRFFTAGREPADRSAGAAVDAMSALVADLAREMAKAIEELSAPQRE